MRNKTCREIAIIASEAYPSPLSGEGNDCLIKINYTQELWEKEFIPSCRKNLKKFTKLFPAFLTIVIDGKPLK